MSISTEVILQYLLCSNLEEQNPDVYEGDSNVKFSNSKKTLLESNCLTRKGAKHHVPARLEGKAQLETRSLKDAAEESQDLTQPRQPTVASFQL